MAEISDRQRVSELTAPVAALGGRELEEKFAPVVEATLGVVRQTAIAAQADENFTVTSVSVTAVDAANEGEGSAPVTSAAKKKKGGAKVQICVWMWGYEYCYESDCPPTIAVL